MKEVFFLCYIFINKYFNHFSSLLWGAAVYFGELHISELVSIEYLLSLANLLRKEEKVTVMVYDTVVPHSFPLK